MMDECKHCKGQGLISANGAVHPCHVCDGYGYVGQPDETDMTEWQAAQVFVLAAIFILLIMALAGVLDGKP